MICCAVFALLLAFVNSFCISSLVVYATINLTWDFFGVLMVYLLCLCESCFSVCG